MSRKKKRWKTELVTERNKVVYLHKAQVETFIWEYSWANTLQKEPNNWLTSFPVKSLDSSKYQQIYILDSKAR